MARIMSVIECQVIHESHIRLSKENEVNRISDMVFYLKSALIRYAVILIHNAQTIITN